jgi:hypothetical protein
VGTIREPPWAIRPYWDHICWRRLKMTTSDIITSVIAAAALVVSLVTAYKTFFTRFSGKVWPATRLVLSNVDNIPSIGLACFFENSGARPGILDDLRLAVKHSESGAIHFFFPQLMRNDYNIFMSYSGEDWFPFSGVSLSPQERTERYVLFKPKNDRFTAQKGLFEVTLESRWYKSKKWDIAPPQLYFELTEEVAERWNNPESPALQVLSNDLLA